MGSSELWAVIGGVAGIAAIAVTITIWLHQASNERRSFTRRQLEELESLFAEVASGLQRIGAMPRADQSNAEATAIATKVNEAAWKIHTLLALISSKDPKLAAPITDFYEAFKSQFNTKIFNIEELRLKLHPLDPRSY